MCTTHKDRNITKSQYNGFKNNTNRFQSLYNTHLPNTINDNITFTKCSWFFHKLHIVENAPIPFLNRSTS